MKQLFLAVILTISSAVHAGQFFQAMGEAMDRMLPLTEMTEAAKIGDIDGINSSWTQISSLMSQSQSKATVGTVIARRVAFPIEAAISHNQLASLSRLMDLAQGELKGITWLNGDRDFYDIVGENALISAGNYANKAAVAHLLSRGVRPNPWVMKRVASSAVLNPRHFYQVFRMLRNSGGDLSARDPDCSGFSPCTIEEWIRRSPGGAELLDDPVVDIDDEDQIGSVLLTILRRAKSAV